VHKLLTAGEISFAATHRYGEATAKRHHAALASYDGKIYVCGGFVAPEKSPLPIGAAS
jgi:hypothetical protein